MLEDVQARAGFDALQARFHTLAATQARLLAEQSAAASVRFPAWLIEATTRTHGARGDGRPARPVRYPRQGARGPQGHPAPAHRAAARGDRRPRGADRADSRQIVLIDEEIQGVEQLYRKGLERKSRLLALQRARTDIEGNRAERRARIARARQAIGETELQIIAQDTAQLEAVNEEASQIQFELAEVEQRLAASRDVLQRTLISAPVDGTVVACAFAPPAGWCGRASPCSRSCPTTRSS